MNSPQVGLLSKRTIARGVRISEYAGLYLQSRVTLRSLQVSTNSNSCAASTKGSCISSVRRLLSRIRLATHSAIALVGFDDRPAIVDTLSGGIHKNQSSRISKSCHHGSDDAAG